MSVDKSKTMINYDTFSEYQIKTIFTIRLEMISKDNPIRLPKIKYDIHTSFAALELTLRVLLHKVRIIRSWLCNIRNTYMQH